MPAAALQRQLAPLPEYQSEPAPQHVEELPRLSRVSRRAKRRHRELRVSLPVALCSIALLGQLTCLLWLHGRALSASRTANELDTEMTVTRNRIARVQERIASLDSSAHLEDWAKARGWKLADHRDFDDVTKLAASAIANPSADQSTSQSTLDAAIEPAATTPRVEVHVMPKEGAEPTRGSFSVGGETP